MGLLIIAGKPKIVERSEEKTIIECDVNKLSDGYHTFDELYEHRYLLFCAFLSTWKGYKEDRWKSKTHWIDGKLVPVWDGWFVAGTKLDGLQISYHLPLKYWDLLSTIPTVETAPEWDGHTSKDVLQRLQNWLL